MLETVHQRGKVIVYAKICVCDAEMNNYSHNYTSTEITFSNCQYLVSLITNLIQKIVFYKINIFR